VSRGADLIARYADRLGELLSEPEAAAPTTAEPLAADPATTDSTPDGPVASATRS
jgi:hypothetical protein